MSLVMFEVCWKPNQTKTFEDQNNQKVEDIIKKLTLQLKLPEFDGQGQRIIYGLYRDNQGERAQIQDALTLVQAHISGERVYVANRADPWWNLQTSPTAPTGKTGKLSRRVSSTDDTRQSPIVSNDSKSYGCRLQLAPNCVVSVPGDHIELNRNYLSETLPSALVMNEKARIFSGYNSRLTHVSRNCHCEIFRQNEQWLIRAHNPTYVYGRILDHDQTVVLRPPGTTIVLGQEGWNVVVELVEL